ncbi:MAG: hypothetical protein GY799_00965 [Desulfobulbaceae bacterium]|nr:hypothetical protein [Desulfobulbaceae bacterium]
MMIAVTGIADGGLSGEGFIIKGWAAMALSCFFRDLRAPWIIRSTTFFKK